MKEAAPDLVISGVNDGPNTGMAQVNSGTVSAAARALRYGFRRSPPASAIASRKRR
jgi:5'-nucleotidase